MTTALTQARPTSVARRRISRPELEMPAEMQQALREFGLMRAFHSLSRLEQSAYTCRVTETAPGPQRREQVARLLDRLFDDVSGEPVDEGRSS